jgi:hypothetical protein
MYEFVTLQDYTGFGLVTGFIGHLKLKQLQVITVISLIYTLQHALVFSAVSSPVIA